MLTPDEVDKVRMILSMEGWFKVMKPRLELRARTALKALALTSTERASAYKGSDYDTTDDVLRAIIREDEWMVAVWSNELAVAEHNRQRDELARQATMANP